MERRSVCSVSERMNGRMNERTNERKFDNQISSLTTNVNMDNKLHEILTFCEC